MSKYEIDLIGGADGAVSLCYNSHKSAAGTMTAHISMQGLVANFIDITPNK